MKKFKVAELASGKGFSEMTKAGSPQTCYDLAVYSLVMTGDLKESVYKVWISEVPKANTLMVVDPQSDTRLKNPQAIPASCLIGFYRRFYAGEQSRLQAETDAGWVIYHMVRSMDVANSTDVVGGNNGDRDGTVPGWSKNDVSRMFDWTGANKNKIWTSDALPAPTSFGQHGDERYVAFCTPIATVVSRLNKAFPGPAAFG